MELITIICIYVCIALVFYISNNSNIERNITKNKRYPYYFNCIDLDLLKYQIKIICIVL